MQTQSTILVAPVRAMLSSKFEEKYEIIGALKVTKGNIHLTEID